MALGKTPVSELWLPALVTLGIGLTVPVLCFIVAQRVLGVSRVDAALAAHHGSVSAVTFAASLTFLAAVDLEPEGFMATLLAVLEVPGIIVALLLAGSRPGARLGRGAGCARR